MVAPPDRLDALSPHRKHYGRARTLRLTIERWQNTRLGLAPGGGAAAVKSSLPILPLQLTYHELSYQRRVAKHMCAWEAFRRPGQTHRWKSPKEERAPRQEKQTSWRGSGWARKVCGCCRWRAEVWSRKCRVCVTHEQTS